jgi:hypothetical protein
MIVETVARPAINDSMLNAKDDYSFPLTQNWKTLLLMIGRQHVGGYL